jgi:hypothetical protein
VWEHLPDLNAKFSAFFLSLLLASLLLLVRTAAASLLLEVSLLHTIPSKKMPEKYSRLH